MELIKKPWGEEVIYQRNDQYVCKLIKVKRGHRLSEQYHNEKTETMLFCGGEGAVTVDGKTYKIREGMVRHIPPKTVHRIEATKKDVVFIETSTPHLDDVVRLKDDYGRHKS
jgi:mannose-1-phosphate guanylyltransferase